MAFFITDKCDGCDACRTACPTNAITGEQFLRHKIDPDLCVSCGLCADLCENEALVNAKGRHLVCRPRELWRTPVIDREACVGCSLCVENCPMFALELSDPGFHGNIHVFVELKYPEKCISCKLCARSCPIGAISMGEAVIDDTVKVISFDPYDDLAEKDLEAILIDTQHGY